MHQISPSLWTTADGSAVAVNMVGSHWIVAATPPSQEGKTVLGTYETEFEALLMLARLEEE